MSGKIIRCTVTADDNTRGVCRKYDNTYPAADGAIILTGGVYETP